MSGLKNVISQNKNEKQASKQAKKIMLHLYTVALFKGEVTKFFKEGKGEGQRERKGRNQREVGNATCSYSQNKEDFTAATV